MKTAIITGASAGLGQSFFRSLVARYPDLDSLWLIARRRERLEQMAEGCPIPVTVLSMDLTDSACYDALGEKLKADGVRVKILINNAGVGELDNVADSDWRTQSRMVDLNCRALTAVEQHHPRTQHLANGGRRQRIVGTAQHQGVQLANIRG